MTDLIPDEAVEAAVGYLPGIPSSYDLMLRKATTRAMLTAAAPIITAQAVAAPRAGIEALRDEWRMHEAANLRAASTQPENSSSLLLHTAIAGLCKAHADALDALLRGA